MREKKRDDKRERRGRDNLEREEEQKEGVADSRTTPSYTTSSLGSTPTRVEKVAYQSET